MESSDELRKLITSLSQCVIERAIRLDLQLVDNAYERQVDWHELLVGHGEGSFARHVRLLAQEDVNVRVVGQTCLRDDLDEPLQLRLSGRYGELLAA